MMHKAYLEEEHPTLYKRLILNGTLHRHLDDANERAEAMMEKLTGQMKRLEGITEHLKAEQPMIWVRRMNNIRSRAEEIVREEVIGDWLGPAEPGFHRLITLPFLRALIILMFVWSFQGAVPELRRTMLMVKLITV